jgi:hypothetical protein
MLESGVVICLRLAELQEDRESKNERPRRVGHFARELEEVRTAFLRGGGQRTSRYAVCQQHVFNHVGTRTVGID